MGIARAATKLLRHWIRSGILDRWQGELPALEASSSRRRTRREIAFTAQAPSTSSPADAAAQRCSVAAARPPVDARNLTTSDQNGTAPISNQSPAPDVVAVHPMARSTRPLEAEPRPALTHRVEPIDRSAAVEPILTRTMAELLASQGHPRRALAIYYRLAQQDADDLTLQQRLHELRRQVLRDSAPQGAQRNEARRDTSAVVAIALDAQRVLIAWQVEEATLAQARMVLQSVGIPTVRAVVVAPHDRNVTQSETRELPAIGLEGEWLLEQLPTAAQITVSIGLQGTHRFVSAVHAPSEQLL